MSLKKLLLALLPLLLAGCSTTITNLTPSQVDRNPSGLYPFEVALDSRQQTIRPHTIRPTVVIGMQSYPMQRTPKVLDRWEALVPLPAGEKVVYYQYKFDYEYNSIPRPKTSSKRSPEYQLQINDR